MRLFVAITLSGELNSRLASLQDELRTCGADVKWVERENLHLTLKFLGEVEPAQALQMVPRLRQDTEGYGELVLHFKGIGVFPAWSRPRVIWVGLDPNPSLMDLHRRVEGALLPLGFGSEPFTPHLTLGRLRSRANWTQLEQRLRLCQGENWGEERVKEIVLMQSHLTPRGPRYEVLETFTLTSGQKFF
ncbi:MAG: RNA 2',3'-cyclic phosphodiesterase [Thermoanaerobacteraceae bacterium]|nr:RNA 2',3'-cyclic phosphodiesterase [Thermoanaerobacteraceae bacterium]